MRRKLSDELADYNQEGSVTLRIRFEAYTDENGMTHQRRINEFVKNPSNFLTPGKLHRYDTLRYNYLDPQFGVQVLSHVQENPYGRPIRSANRCKGNYAPSIDYLSRIRWRR